MAGSGVWITGNFREHLTCVVGTRDELTRTWSYRAATYTHPSSHNKRLHSRPSHNGPGVYGLSPFLSVIRVFGPLHSVSFFRLFFHVVVGLPDFFPGLAILQRFAGLSLTSGRGHTSDARRLSISLLLPQFSLAVALFHLLRFPSEMFIARLIILILVRTRKITTKCDRYLSVPTCVRVEWAR